MIWSWHHQRNKIPCRVFFKSRKHVYSSGSDILKETADHLTCWMQRKFNFPKWIQRSMWNTLVFISWKWIITDLFLYYTQSCLQGTDFYSHNICPLLIVKMVSVCSAVGYVPPPPGRSARSLLYRRRPAESWCQQRRPHQSGQDPAAYGRRRGTHCHRRAAGPGEKCSRLMLSLKQVQFIWAHIDVFAFFFYQANKSNPQRLTELFLISHHCIYVFTEWCRHQRQRHAEDDGSALGGSAWTPRCGWDPHQTWSWRACAQQVRQDAIRHRCRHPEHGADAAAAGETLKHLDWFCCSRINSSYREVFNGRGI